MNGHGSNNSHEMKKLPINLFHSPGQYSKLLIQNKSKSNKYSHNTMGIVRDLEYLNNPVFEREQAQRQKRMRNHKQQLKKQLQSKTKIDILQDCCCCCCQQFCEKCVTNSKCSTQEQKLMPLSINIGQMFANAKVKEKKSKQIIHKIIRSHSESHLERTKIYPKDNYKSSFCTNVKMKEYTIKSLIKEAQQKRVRQLKEVQKQHQNKRLIQYNQFIRETNRNLMKVNQEISKKKKLSQSTNYEVRNQYWLSVKDKLLNQAQKQIKPSSMEFYEPIINPKISRFSKEKIQSLRKKHSKEAIKKINNQKRLEQQKRKQIQKSLKKLNEERLEILKNCELIEFKPTNKMIEKAFVDKKSDIQVQISP